MADRSDYGDQRLRALALGIRNRDILRNLIRSGRFTFDPERSRAHPSIQDDPRRFSGGDWQPDHPWNWTGRLASPSRWRYPHGDALGRGRRIALDAEEKARVWQGEGHLGQAASPKIAGHCP